MSVLAYTKQKVYEKRAIGKVSLIINQGEPTDVSIPFINTKLHENYQNNKVPITFLLLKRRDMDHFNFVYEYENSQKLFRSKFTDNFTD